MKNIITLIMLLIMSVPSEGAISGDMSEYVRREVYDVQMQGVNGKLDMILDGMKELREELKEIRAEQKSQRNDISRLSNTVSGLTARVDGLDARMTDNAQNLGSRIDDMKQYIYLVLVLLGIVIVLPSVQKFLEWRDSRKPLITLEDVKRLIEENNAELLKSLRG